MYELKDPHTTFASSPEAAHQRPLGLPILAIGGLALLGVPRVVLHDMGLIEEGTFINSLFVFVPVVIWVAVTVLMRLRRPFLTLLVVSVTYGVFLALVHQIFWGAAFPGGTPELGGNLAGLDPMAQSVIVRFFSVITSLVTGALVGVVTGLIAAGLSALLPSGTSGSNSPGTRA